MKGKAFFDKFVWFLVVLGGVNWGLVGAFNYNLVAVVLGAVPTIVSVLYVFIGFAALYLLFSAFKGSN